MIEAEKREEIDAELRLEVDAIMRMELEELKFAIRRKRGTVCWFGHSCENEAGRTQICHQEKKRYCKLV